MNVVFTRRLDALEKRFFPAPECEQPRETKLSRSLLGRLEAGRRRVAESHERRGLPASVEVEPCNAQIGCRTIVEILHAGRHRSALAHQALVEASRPPL